MVKIILGVVVGFIGWTILWVGSDEIFKAVSPGWYGENLADFERAMTTKASYTVNSAILIIALIRSVVVSIISGFIAAWIAGENYKSTLGLGVLLLAFGIFTQAIYWNYVPLWYHVPFLFLLIPATIFGGKLRPLSSIQ